MNEEGIVTLAVVLPLIVISGGVLVILMAMYQRTKAMEMKHRERMAMIERGLAPAPEQDPAAFEEWGRHHAQPVSRSTRVGVIWIAIGLGLMLIIGFAGAAPGAAVGVGGAIVVIGVAFIVNGELQRRTQPPPPWRGPADQPRHTAPHPPGIQGSSGPTGQ